MMKSTEKSRIRNRRGKRKEEKYDVRKEAYTKRTKEVLYKLFMDHFTYSFFMH